MAIEARAERRPGRIGRWLGAIGVAGLAVLGLAYWLTYEPAPRVRVRWREWVTVEHRTALERGYLLRNPRDPLPEGTLAYDLLDTSRANIQGLVANSDIADLHDIDDATYSVRFETDYGGEWMWIAHRVPGLRDSRVRAAVIVGLLLMALGGVWTSDLRAWWRGRVTAR